MQRVPYREGCRLATPFKNVVNSLQVTANIAFLSQGRVVRGRPACEVRAWTGTTICSSTWLALRPR